ncbi:hypothetical protein [Luteolibacter marinus]|uniref:hypothetical protein n=1 Tax=Luteolibacter marinus TaxID=2776705 RepID=UPI001866C683|nr:hypothetical protein [Luteolibacter marinus]
MLDLIIVAIALSLGGYLAFAPRLGKSSKWKATVTPLASIMGSGFLVCAPLLGGTVGNLALACIAVLLVIAYGVGAAIRFNIRHFEPIENDGHHPAQSIAFLSRIVLAGAYFISVSYYLQLLAAFVGNGLGIDSPLFAHVLCTVLLALIGGIGMWRGLAMLERLEKYAVALNLGMIAALLCALVYHNARLAVGGEWHLPAVETGIDFHDLRVLLGLLIVVQGFETSRYLGEKHSADERITTMRIAQLVSAAIYLVFVALVTVLFKDGLGAKVTDIIGLTRPVAAVLPFLIAIAAVGSQFSAAVADNEGAGGLVADISRGKISSRAAYALILAVTVAITWLSNVNAIIAYASRAFALFYALQCGVALLVAWHKPGLAARKRHLAFFAVLAVVCLVVFSLGLPAES